MSVPSDDACGVPNAAPFTQQQKDDLKRLWKTQFHDTQDCENFSDRIKPINKDCDVYLRRLHRFFFAFLKKHTGVQPPDRNSNNEQDGGNNQFLKENLRESCLEPLYSRFTEKPEKRGAGDEGILRLKGEKLLIMLHHEEFLFELNQYEFRGQFRSDDSTCVNHCFGAYLYHHPIDAFLALNVSMALAVLSLWRLRHNIFLGSESSIRKKNDVSKIERFLGCCRINVRFVHVSPHLPMADIKTGLVKKFISVKGHVVKARPRRLRVSTADL